MGNLSNTLPISASVAAECPYCCLYLVTLRFVSGKSPMVPPKAEGIPVAEDPAVARAVPFGRADGLEGLSPILERAFVKHEPVIVVFGSEFLRVSTDGEDPDTFDPDRKNARQHLAFGRGIHSCPGAPLARAETRVGLERLLDRTTDIRISEKHHGPASSRRYQYIPTYILRGLTQLHIEFDVR